MESKLLKILKTIINVLSLNDKLSFEKNDLFNFSASEVMTPVGNVLPLLLAHKSKLGDKIIDLDLLKNLIDILNKNNSIIRLDHVGFCYKVLSQEDEKKRLATLIKQTKFHLYEETSNDNGLWLFIGDVDQWEKPLIELLPVEKTDDRWVEYWLPHTQIDIDTTLAGEEIERLIGSVFGKEIKPYPIVIDGITYIIRNHLGSIEGVNIFLDLATNLRNVKLHRQKDLIKII